MLRPVTDYFGLKIRKIFWNFFDHNALLQVFLFPFSHFLNQFGKPKVFCKTYLWLENLIYRNKFTILQSIMKNYKNVLLRKNGHSLEYLNEVHVILIDVQERLLTPNCILASKLHSEKMFWSHTIILWQEKWFSLLHYVTLCFQ